MTTDATHTAVSPSGTGGSGISQPRWTHIALPSGDLDKSIEFYTTMTPLVVVATREDADGRNAWLSNPGQWETPFVLVLSAFNSAAGTQQGIMKPFAHIGIEVPNREDIDAIAERARENGSLWWEPRDMPDPIGYICAVHDPDGNVVEFSHNQRVFSTVRKLWGPEPS
ncbi:MULTISPECIES: VOC family protein [unclassified Pseudofrankia]|uniref:VOC family protein n=1 Tax=unclassified Pseudofrankia TaxID=2994372 RepID=UPI0008DB1141|nr:MULTISPECIES: VOC family protein [unclassified Pseudofrankia]MDT3440089.1 VOC family protein [Pseudofrankia sp. BMG5.37]OHV44703.1 glyoxalase [Pseudofrankia sp. BMG5.36]